MKAVKAAANQLRSCSHGTPRAHMLTHERPGAADADDT